VTPLPRIDPRDLAAVTAANKPRLLAIAAAIQTVTRTIELTKKETT
jgi:hypothetical protein